MSDQIYFIKSDISCIIDNLNEISEGVKKNKKIKPVIDNLIDNIINRIKSKLEEIKSDIDEIEKRL